ncbi:uncharacterized protein KD926_010590 [Aspergillus affinis]|uniref:uncharacterized protein n=1 Tax=Aspergillus affinis TaxID=1070780 RepID=UPI0022FE6DFE|nr:uncharacterized protein KD926_010590 [Aspergillus affinis]KAI9038646.1 hypothetical protein KD926_010590 [Aspergillus affinis]
MVSSTNNSGRLSVQPETDVDVVAVPSIGGDPSKTWIDEDSQRSWPVTDLAKHIPNARVLLIDHGTLSPQDGLDSLGHRLLIQLLHERQHTNSRRPIFFICHSTGGLVVKAALVIAGHSASHLNSIFSSCYGIAFLATPHKGSTYLSAPEYAKSVRRLMQPRYHVPHQMRELFRPRHPSLLHLTNQFRSISADIKIWSLLETVDSVLNVTDSGTHGVVEMNVPITSIRSGLLDFEHEKEIPLATDHVGTACFKGQEATTRLSFIKELEASTSVARQLSLMADTPLHVEDETLIQVNGFFEDTARGVSDETPLKLWSTKTRLSDYLKDGPSICLEDRLTSTARIPSGSFDDSSVSSFDSRPSSAMAGPDYSSYDELDSEDITAAHTKSIPSRPTMKRSRSYLAQSSPRIHVSEPAVESYFDEQNGDSASRDNNAGLKSDTHVESVAGLSSQPKRLLPVPPSTRDRHNQDRCEIPRAAPRFDRPEPGSEKLVWIHVPYTHTGWVPPVLSKACEEEQRPEFFRKFINEENWFSNLVRARHLEPHARFVRPTCIHSRQDDPTTVDKEEGSHGPQLAIYLPYLHWDTYCNLVQRRNAVEQRLQQGRSKPVPDSISKASHESQLIWRFLGSEPPIHIRRTLDQYGYPNLRSTVARDDDQMLWKRTKKFVDPNEELGQLSSVQDVDDPQKPIMDGKVLMVDQLWLWIVDPKTVVTFFPKQEATTAEGKLYEQANLFNSIYNELNGDLARRFETVGDLAALIVLHAVTVLLDRTLHHDLQIESMTRSFKRFRGRGFIVTPSDYNKTQGGKPMTTEERFERDYRIVNQHRADLSTLLELRDIVDELGTVLKLLEQQTATVKIMASYFEEKGYGKVFIESALSRLEDYHTQVLEMKENAYSAQKDAESLLDIKQEQANIDESRMARWQAEVTRDQSQSVMVFTIFTVIFLPLSFFTSLFGINVREWSGEETNLTMSQMLSISGPTSFAIIVIALLMAFSERLRDVTAKAQKVAFGITREFIFRPLGMMLHGNRNQPNTKKQKVTPSINTDRTTRKERFGRYLGNRQLKDDDIWDRHEDRVISPLPPPVLGSDGEKVVYSTASKERQLDREMA